MKKINSNGYAHKIIGLATLFLIGLPFCLHMIGLLVTVELRLWIHLSLAIGLLILLFFAILLLIEFYQDRKINREYVDLKKKKIPLENGKYECQSCGNRQVTIMDNNCGICGISFEPKGAPTDER